MDGIDIYNDSRYCKYTKMLLNCAGCWPLSDPRKNLIKIILIIICMLPATAGLVLGLYREKTDLIRICDNVNFIIISSCLAVYLICFYIFNEKQINLINKINKHWSDITSKEEIKIMEKFTREGRLFTLVYTTLGYIGMNMIFALCLIEPMFDKFIPLGGPRKKMLPAYVDYRINETKYYYYIFGHLYICAFLLITTTLAFDTFFVTTVQHLLALLAVVRFRLKSISKISGISSNFLSESAQDRVYKRLMGAVDMHKTALKYSRLLEDNCRIPFLFGIMITVLTFICIMAQVLIALQTIKNEPSCFIRSASICIVYLVRMYIMAFVADRARHSSNSVFEKAYAVEWYKFSKKSKFVVQMLILRSLTPCQIKCGIVDLNIESLSKMMKASMSYVTVIISSSRKDPTLI